jgi:hypothetical protein
MHIKSMHTTALLCFSPKKFRGFRTRVVCSSGGSDDHCAMAERYVHLRMYVYKRYIQLFDCGKGLYTNFTFYAIKKLPKVNNLPKGENSPNLDTLIPYILH